MREVYLSSKGNDGNENPGDDGVVTLRGQQTVPACEKYECAEGPDKGAAAFFHDVFRGNEPDHNHERRDTILDQIV